MSRARQRPKARAVRERAASGTRAAPGGPPTPSGLRTFLLPLVLTLGLLSLSLLPRVGDSPALERSVWGAAIVLLVWQVTLFLELRRAGAGRQFRVVLRPQHWLQALVQTAVFAYWGWYWRPVYDFAGLLMAQLAFAYAFDILLAWTRRETYALGFGPFPIIFSINLFLWFRDEWFYLQFLMIALGFLGKEFVRWRREGRAVHIFNPSAFSLGLFSFALIVTDTSHVTWGQEIASTLTLAPGIYLYLFSLGLIVMYFFSITLIAGSAAAVIFGLSALYSAWTGIPYFLDSEIPAAVFLGLHLLVTDPSTSPRTPLGKAVFGALYGIGVFVLYTLLGAAGAPTFYDKLLAVPLLNLSVRAIDGMVRAIGSRPAWSRWRLRGVGLRPNLVHIALWIAFFATMAAAGRTDGRHAGDSVPFWEQACEEERPTACRRLLQVVSTYCGDNSGWACNELGRHYAEGVIIDRDAEVARAYFTRSCEARFQAGCLNLLDHDPPSRAAPRALDLRLLLREGGLNLMEMPVDELYARACEHRWAFACERITGAEPTGPRGSLAAS